ncbi:MAG: dienelactone hydrolase family protein [Parvibaculaceae bacterium]|nr:dienelactone hydrolase family protein [Parvibaculaceae bacterium]HBM88682.1 alpha/beta hydrolase [Rhodobiaceae bacterium]
MKLKLATFFWPLAALITLSVNGCSTPDLKARQLGATSIVPATYEERTLATQSFDLRSYAPRDKTPRQELRVFIEGDGFAWERRDRPSSDPTPITQTVLSLVAASKQLNLIYLARPCQFVGARSRNCQESLWTNERYSEAVVSSLNQAIDHLKTEYKANRLVLIGYSGGGTLAALLAARRSDVSGFVTLAAPLDIAAFSEFHNVSPMTGSLNPIDQAHILSGVPQTHFAGDNDQVVPLQLVLAYQHALAHDQCTMIIKASADHWSGWTDIVPNPADITPTCKAYGQ